MTGRDPVRMRLDAVYARLAYELADWRRKTPTGIAWDDLPEDVRDGWWGGVGAATLSAEIRFIAQLASVCTNTGQDAAASALLEQAGALMEKLRTVIVSALGEGVLERLDREILEAERMTPAERDWRPI